MSGTPVYFETKGKSKSKGVGSIQFTLTPQTQPFLLQLWNSDGLLRYSEPREVSIEDLVAAGGKHTNLDSIILHNRMDIVKRDQVCNWFRLPSDDPEKPLGVYDCKVTRVEGRWTLAEFREDL